MYYYMILPQKIVSFSINKNELKIIKKKKTAIETKVSPKHMSLDPFLRNWKSLRSLYNTGQPKHLVQQNLNLSLYHILPFSISKNVSSRWKYQEAQIF